VCEIVPGTGEVARFPVETLGTHKDGNTEHNVTSTGSPTVTPGNESLTKQPHSTIEGVQTTASYMCVCVCVCGEWLHTSSKLHLQSIWHCLYICSLQIYIHYLQFERNIVVLCNYTLLHVQVAVGLST
jgi:hypothetical protein